jgi:branched-chain amino acid transport system substrate-binding protein
MHMKKKPAHLAAALGTAAALVLTACGSSASGDGGSAGSTGGSASKDPIKVALMIPIAASPTTADIYTDPAKMAVDEINAAGGIDGRKLSLQSYDAGFDAEGAIKAMTKAVADGVGLVVGLPVADQVLAVRPLLDRAKIPLLYLGGGFAAGYDPKSATGSSEWSFRVGPPSELTVNAGVQYAVKKLNAPKIGLILRGDASQETSTQQAQAGAKAADGQITATRSIPTTSTDVTTQTLAMQGTDAIFTTDYVAEIAAILKAVKQQGLNVPVITGQTGMTVYLQKVAPDLIHTMFSSAPCNMFDPYNDKAKKWVTDFQAKYNFMPDPNSSTTYDAFYLFKQALQHAKGQTGAPLLKQLESIKMNGVCAPYAVNKQHFMSQSEVVISFAGDTPKTVATYDFAQ